MAADERLIFHCDCNNFFASCECLERPELKNVPMAVAGDPEYRTGIVVAKNELAKRAGVKTTDTGFPPEGDVAPRGVQAHDAVGDAQFPVAGQPGKARSLWVCSKTTGRRVQIDCRKAG